MQQIGFVLSPFPQVDGSVVTNKIVLGEDADAPSFDAVTGLPPPIDIGWTFEAGAWVPPVDVRGLDERRRIAGISLRQACAATITSGFESAALGATHFYPSDEASQRNMALATGGGPLWCKSDGAWALAPHDPGQIAGVLADFTAHRVWAQTHLDSLLAQVDEATSGEAIDAITWE